MLIGTVRMKLYAPWVHSLKEKRMIVKSILSRAHNKFNISCAEIDGQDLHQTIVLGFACVAQTAAQADSIIEHLISFVENNTDAEITDIQRENR